MDYSHVLVTVARPLNLQRDFLFSSGSIPTFQKLMSPGNI